MSDFALSPYSRCEESIMAVVPDISQFEKEGHNVGKGQYRVPLFLVRIDGVIYATGMTFTYAGGPDSVGYTGPTQVQHRYV